MSIVTGERTHATGTSLKAELKISIAGRFCAILLAFMLAALPAHAAEKKQPPKIKTSFDAPMSFVIVRSNAGYCEPNCPEWIYGEGQITAGTPAAFRKILKQMGERKLPLVLISPGGNVEAAIEVGRLVRKNKIPVEIGYTRFVPCRPSEKGCVGDSPAKGEFRGEVMISGAFCWSACPLILAGGERRLSSAWSHTGVHQVTTVYKRERIYYREKFRMVNGKKKVISRKILSRKKAGTQVTTKLPKSTRKLLTAYFRDMGIEKSLLDAMLSTAPDKIRKLEPVEMLDMKLITELSSTDMLTNAMICVHETTTPNCVMRNPPPKSAISAQAPPVQN